MWKVLIADDEPKIRKGLKKLTQSLDLKLEIVGEAEDGEIALQLAKDLKPHILLVDINMPFINGLEFIEEVYKFLPHAIVIIISGYSQFDYAQKAIKLRVFDYLLKPVKPSELKDILSQAIENLEKSPNITKTDDDSTEDTENYSPIVNLIKKYIDDNYMKEDISLKEVAENFDISPSYLGKLMKQELDKTFIEYLTNIRIKNAKKMLEEENINIKIYEVAQLVGYGSQHYFSRVFKKEVGVTPLEYKQNLKLE
ncbi:MAG: response regulator [Clostridiales bacterium]|nr:response regulator [Clostridiales bacterium]